ncbi:MAG: HAD family hydrolase [Oscillospiraceae bacterium]|nr:HAD family hydrolase [Oscillospiraceae bacterium]
MKAVLFDLDGTLLPMDQDAFTRAYFHALCKKMAPIGFAPDALTKAVWAGTAAMVKNNGSQTNEAAFWQTFSALCSVNDEAKAAFERFYETDFNDLRTVCGFTEMARQTVRILTKRGVRVILASNPIFPRIAQENRMRWAGVEPSDFSYITSYENSHFCKPNPAYYTEIMEKNGLCAEDCRMVGNDAQEDLAAEKAGIRTFLLTDCLIDREKTALSDQAKGDFAALCAWLEKE